MLKEPSSFFSQPSKAGDTFWPRKYDNDWVLAVCQASPAIKIEHAIRFIYCCWPGFAVAAVGLAGGGITLHSGQPTITSGRFGPRRSRRFAISAWNSSSVNGMIWPRSMNMFAIDRFPDPCQLRGSGMFLLFGVLSM